MLAATAVSATALADGGDDDQHGAAFTLTFTLTVSFTRSP